MLCCLTKNPKNLSTQESTINLSFICRICHDGNNNEELVDPCDCSGTVAFVHVSCLEKWLATSNTQHCELCNYEFSIQKKNKPFTHESFCKWFNAMLMTNPRIVIGDITCFTFLTPMCIIATYLCGLGALAYGRNRFWESFGLITLSVVLLITYTIWLVVTIRTWKIWCEHDTEIKLILKHRTKNKRLEDDNFHNVNSLLDINERNSNINVSLEPDVISEQLFFD